VEKEKERDKKEKMEKNVTMTPVSNITLQRQREGRSSGLLPCCSKSRTAHSTHISIRRGGSQGRKGRVAKAKKRKGREGERGEKGEKGEWEIREKRKGEREKR
jgi:hypothetical protein